MNKQFILQELTDLQNRLQSETDTTKKSTLQAKIDKLQAKIETEKTVSITATRKTANGETITYIKNTLTVSNVSEKEKTDRAKRLQEKQKAFDKKDKVDFLKHKKTVFEQKIKDIQNQKEIVKKSIAKEKYSDFIEDINRKTKENATEKEKAYNVLDYISKTSVVDRKVYKALVQMCKQRKCIGIDKSDGKERKIYVPTQNALTATFILKQDNSGLFSDMVQNVYLYMVECLNNATWDPKTQSYKTDTTKHFDFGVASTENNNIYLTFLSRFELDENGEVKKDENGEVLDFPIAKKGFYKCIYDTLTANKFVIYTKDLYTVGQRPDDSKNGHTREASDYLKTCVFKDCFSEIETNYFFSAFYNYILSTEKPKTANVLITVIRGLCRGLKYKEIASVMKRSESSIKKDVEKIRTIYKSFISVYNWKLSTHKSKEFFGTKHTIENHFSGKTLKTWNTDIYTTLEKREDIKKVTIDRKSIKNGFEQWEKSRFRAKDFSHVTIKAKNGYYNMVIKRNMQGNKKPIYSKTFIPFSERVLYHEKTNDIENETREIRSNLSKDFSKLNYLFR